MTSLAYFLHAFRGLVVALVVLVAGASITAPGADAGAMAPVPGELSAGAADSGGLTGSGLGPNRVGSSRSSHSSAGAWRESSRRAPVEVEATEIVEADAERDDAPPHALGVLSFGGGVPALLALGRPALPLVSSSSLSAPYFDKSRPRGPPIG